MTKRFLSLIVFLLVMSSALAGCTSGGSSGSSGSGGESPQTLTYASTTKVVGLSPIKTNDSASSAVIAQIYETLFTRDPETMEIKSLLAKSYETPNNKTWVIHLREGIKFHDGTPFTAKAVKYTFDKFRDPETAAPRASLLEPIKKVIAKDKYTVVIKTKYPYGPMLAALAHTNSSIVSPAADKKQDLMKKPVGTGPFKLKEYTPGDHITLVKNKNYWKGEPKLDEVTFKVVPKISTAISMMQTGEVQFIDGIPPEQLPRLESIKNIQVEKKPGTPVYYLGFNMTKKPMSDLAFRKAVSYAVNRDAWVKQLDGLGIRSNSIIGPKVFGYTESAEELGYNYNPEKAKQIIKENGYKGTKIELLVSSDSSNYKNMATIVQAQLEKVGINAKIKMLEWGTYLDVTKKGDFDMMFLGWTNSTADGSELLYPNLHSDNIGGANRVRYSNPTFDKLVMASRTTVDQELRKKKLAKANAIAIKDAPWVVMHHGIVTFAHDKSVKGLQVDPTGQWSLYNVYRE